MVGERGLGGQMEGRFMRASVSLGEGRESYEEWDEKYWEVTDGGRKVRCRRLIPRGSRLWVHGIMSGMI